MHFLNMIIINEVLQNIIIINEVLQNIIDQSNKSIHPVKK